MLSNKVLPSGIPCWIDLIDFHSLRLNISGVRRAVLSNSTDSRATRRQRHLFALAVGLIDGTASNRPALL